MALIVGHTGANASPITIEFSVHVSSLQRTVANQTDVLLIDPIIGLGSFTFDVDEVTYEHRDNVGGGVFTTFGLLTGVQWSSPVLGSV